MIVNKQQSWKEANKNYLIASLKIVRKELEFYVHKNNASDKGSFKPSEASVQLLQNAEEALPEKAALDTICDAFALNSFERKILLMCAGVELIPEFGELVAKLQGHAELVHPTFNLAMAYLSEAHWEAISPVAALRKWNLIHIKNTSVLIKSKLIIDEFVLHYLTGVNYSDERLHYIIRPLKVPERLSPSQENLVHRILYQVFEHQVTKPGMVITLDGEENADQMMVAYSIAQKRGIQLFNLPVHAFPDNRIEILQLAKMWNREAALNKNGLYIEGKDLSEMDATKVQLFVEFINHLESLIIINRGDWINRINKANYNFEVYKPERKEQFDLWKELLGNIDDTIDDVLKDVVAHFNLSAKTILDAVAEIKMVWNNQKEASKENALELRSIIWEMCCKYTRPKVDSLAHLVKPIATWADIVLPKKQIATLKQIANQVKNRAKVYEEWAFSTKSSRGLGISVLFTGESGTGKTMSAEVLANELNLDLYRIDLSQVVNKYIGETEKNLKRVFDAAEEGGAILLFDEADALFGKRSEVKDSHDRYSNIEVGYLLQRMEAYRGLAILTTNMKNAIDDAFLRRIRFVVHFKKPDIESRSIIWKKAFTPETKLAQLDYAVLSHINFPGGNIQNIALNAAFRGANNGSVIQMYHIYDAIISEFDKIEKTISRIDLEILRKSVWKSLLVSFNSQLDYQFLSRLNLSGEQIREITQKAILLSKKQHNELDMQHLLKVLNDPQYHFENGVLNKLEAYKAQIEYAS